MTELMAYWNGQLVPANQLSIPVWDAGFVQGVTVAEQLRTFDGRLFRWEQHLARLRTSLQTVGIKLPSSLEDLGRIATELIANNRRRLAEGDDLGLSLFVTPGPYTAFAPPDVQGPTVAMHTYPVPFRAFADKYARGERLIVSRIRQVPADCWPPFLKCRSRMHYFLADQEARAQDPAARALLLDHEGFISEASTASFLLYREQVGLLSPPREKVLPGVSVAVLEELATRLQVPFTCRDLSRDDLATADEALLSSTSPCLLPVVAIDGRPVGSGKPGPMFQRLIGAWSQLLGLDIVGQAQQFASRP